MSQEPQERPPEPDEAGGPEPDPPPDPLAPRRPIDRERPPAGDQDAAPPTLGDAVHAPPPGTRPAAHRAPGPGPEDAEEPPAPAELRSVIESLLFAADRPLSVDRLRELCGLEGGEIIRETLQALQRGYQEQGRGIHLHEVAGGFQLRTAPQNATYVQRLLQQKPVRLSRAQLETLAIVAYRQPITRPEIDDIRGVDSGGTLKVLLERNLLRVLGKKEEPGRPLLYGTTREFLEFFNLRDLRDLPTLREFYELSEEHQAQVSAMASALEETERPRPSAGPGRPGAPAAPPPLTRVELGDLQLGDDEEELQRIDRLIVEVRTDFPLAEVLQQAGVSPAPSPGPPLSGGPAAAPAASPREDDPPPEEL